MKKSIIILVLSISITLTGHSANNPSLSDIRLDATVVVSKKLHNPYSSFKKTEMVKVYEKGSYSLWKCPIVLIDKYPNTNILFGKTYSYFVYKNDNFHLTVTELNKSDVYNFFVNSNI